MKKTLSWAFYDWANSAFATTVMAGFFPVFFKNYWSVGTEASVSTFQLGMANSVSSVIVALLAPVIGAIADRGGAKKKFLFYFAMMGIVMTGSLYFVEKGDWPLAVFVYVIAIVGFMGGNVFYDSLIINVSTPEKMNRVSALGYSLGYLGGGILFSLNVWMTLRPETFGIASPEEAIKISFVLVALWWAVFSIPVFLFVKVPRRGDEASGFSCVKEGFAQLKNTFNEARKLRVVFTFLIAYWLYIDGVDTMVRMAVDFGISIGFDTSNLILALLITQFVGFPSAIFMGKVGDWVGAKRGIYICLSVYVLVTVYAFFMTDVREFYALAIAIGLVQGGVQSLSRSFYTTLIPKSKAAEFFGLYNMLGKFAAVIGPLLMGWVALLTKSPRLSVLSIIVLFIAGMWLLSYVNEEEGKRMARELE